MRPAVVEPLFFLEKRKGPRVQKKKREGIPISKMGEDSATSRNRKVPGANPGGGTIPLLCDAASCPAERINKRGLGGLLCDCIGSVQ